jgi:hypothetical protein
MRWSTLHSRRRRRLLNESRLHRSLVRCLAGRLAWPIAEKVTIEDITVGYVNDDWVKNCATLRIKTSYVVEGQRQFYCQFPITGEMAEENTEYLKAVFIERIRAMLAAYIVNRRYDKGINRYMRSLQRESIASLKRRVDESKPKHKLVRATR